MDAADYFGFTGVALMGLPVIGWVVYGLWQFFRWAWRDELRWLILTIVLLFVGAVSLFIAGEIDTPGGVV